MTNFSNAELRNRFTKEMLREQLYDAYPQFIAAQDNNTYVTLIFNRGSMSFDLMKSILKRYMKSAERTLFGRRFYARPAHRRVQGWFFAEKLGSNAHWHGSLKFPQEVVADEMQHQKAINVFTYKWDHYVKSGNAKMDAIGEDCESGHDYITKERWKEDFFDQLVMAQEFWRASKPGRKS